jgi:hypothetical protein
MNAPFRHPGQSRDPLGKCHAGSAARAERIYWAPVFAGVTIDVVSDRETATASTENVSEKTKEEVHETPVE